MARHHPACNSRRGTRCTCPLRRCASLRPPVCASVKTKASRTRIHRVPPDRSSQKSRLLTVHGRKVAAPQRHAIRPHSAPQCDYVSLMRFHARPTVPTRRPERVSSVFHPDTSRGWPTSLLRRRSSSRWHLIGQLFVTPVCARARSPVFAGARAVGSRPPPMSKKCRKQLLTACVLPGDEYQLR